MNQQTETHVSNRVVSILRLSLVLAFSLLLLIFIGLGEARRTYPRFELEKIAAQGELIQTAMEPFLLADLPLEQFPGFTTLTQPILDSTASIYAIYVSDLQEKTAFSNITSQADNIQSHLDLSDPNLLDQFEPSNFQQEEDHFTITENENFYQISYKLEGRLQTVGQLHIVMAKSVVEETISSSFDIVKIAAGVVLVIFIVFLFLTSRYWNCAGDDGWSQGGIRLLAVSYGVAFLIIAALEIITLLNIYAAGIEAKTESLANSLGYRINSALDLGLSVNDFRDLDVVFDEYESLNPDLSYVALAIDDHIIIHTDEDRVGTTWVSPADHFEYIVNLEQYREYSDSQVTLHLGLGIPKNVVYRRLWRAARNFLALFVASAFVTSTSFSLIRSLSNKPDLTPQTMPDHRGYLLNLIGPLYFLIIFITHGLSAAFLPQYFQQRALESGVKLDISSLFSVYYAMYALALPLTGGMVEKRGPRRFLLIGASLILSSLLLLSFAPGFYVLFLIQIISGFGGGMFFIAVQSYVLKIASAKQRTKGAAIIVNSLYGALLSGTAIGALLVVDPAFGQRGVFLLGSLTAAMALFYVIQLIPKIAEADFSEPALDTTISDDATLSITHQFSRSTLEAEMKEAEEPPGFLSRLLKGFSDFEFVATALMIGIPVKIITAGVFKASLPLILSRYSYPTEDVGQILMLYSGGVLVSSSFIARLTDRIGKTRLVLFIGAVGSGLGLLLAGMIGSDLVGQSGIVYLATVTLLVGMSLLGISHGFIQAPIITHVANTEAAKQMGKSSATSLYRLFERVGNIGGPLFVGALLVYSDYNAFTVSWIGIGTITLGLLFFFIFRKR